MSDYLGIIGKVCKENKAVVCKELPLLHESENLILVGKPEFDVCFFEDADVCVLIQGFVSSETNSSWSKNNNVSISHQLGILYKSDPDEFCTTILGNYSICIFDKKTSKLILLKDHMGSRPIFYFEEQGLFVFSSNLSIILNAFPKCSHLCKSKLIDFLSLRISDIQTTFYSKIKRMAPSQKCIFSDKAAEFSDYHYLDCNVRRQNPREFDSFFEDAIKRTLTSSRKLGIMMSGGLDSTAVALGLKKLGLSDVETFSGNFPHLPGSVRGRTDETIFQHSVSTATGYPHNFISLERKSPVESLKHLNKYFGEPIFFPNLYLFESIIEVAKQHNISTMYDGQDGDTTVSHGFERMYELFKAYNLPLLLYEVYRYSQFNKLPIFKTLKFFMRNIFIKIGLKKSEISNNSLIHDDVYLSNYKDQKKIQTAVDSHEEKLNNPIRVLALESNYILFKRHGIETRSPFFDLPLTHFCKSMPSDWKLRHGRSRYVLRQYLKNKVPSIISDRKGKSDLSYGLKYTLTDSDIELIENEFINLHPILSDILDDRKLKKYIFLLRTPDKVSDTVVTSVMVFFSVNFWLRSNHQQNFD